MLQNPIEGDLIPAAQPCEGAVEGSPNRDGLRSCARPAAANTSSASWSGKSPARSGWIRQGDGELAENQPDDAAAT